MPPFHRDANQLPQDRTSTGEPIPADRGPGEDVIGRAINGAGSLLIEVTATGAEGFLAQVIRHVEDARALKPGVLHLVDRILRVYTPTILAVAGLALAGWLAGSWALTGEPDVRRAVFAARSVLVMGYPCAVGIAAPLAIVRGAGIAADHGIIMRTGEAFQTFRQVRRIVLDKTGTLTEGKPPWSVPNPSPAPPRTCSPWQPAPNTAPNTRSPAPSVPRRRDQGVIGPRATFVAVQQTGLDQDRQVMGDGGLAQGQRFGQVAHA